MLKDCKRKQRIGFILIHKNSQQHQVFLKGQSQVHYCSARLLMALSWCAIVCYMQMTSNIYLEPKSFALMLSNNNNHNRSINMSNVFDHFLNVSVDETIQRFWWHFLKKKVSQTMSFQTFLKFLDYEKEAWDFVVQLLLFFCMKFLIAK